MGIEREIWCTKMSCDGEMRADVEEDGKPSPLVEVEESERASSWWAGVVFHKGAGGGCGLGALLCFHFGTGMTLPW